MPKPPFRRSATNLSRVEPGHRHFLERVAVVKDLYAQALSVGVEVNLDLAVLFPVVGVLDHVRGRFIHRHCNLLRFLGIESCRLGKPARQLSHHVQELRVTRETELEHRPLPGRSVRGVIFVRLDRLGWLSGSHYDLLGTRVAVARDPFLFGVENAADLVESQNLEDTEHRLVQACESDVTTLGADILNMAHDDTQTGARNVGKARAVDYDPVSTGLHGSLYLLLELPHRVAH